MRLVPPGQRPPRPDRFQSTATEIAPDLACVALSLVNAYFVGRPGDRHWVVVDCGLGSSAAKIIRAAEFRFGPDARPAAILLTHGHFDHVGSARELAEYWNVPVYAHEMELPYLTGRSEYPPPDPAVGGGGMSLLSRFYPRGPVDLSDYLEVLPADGTVPPLPEWRWVATPGHSPGHVAFFRDRDRTLIAGDAIVTLPQESATAVVFRPTSVCRPPAYFTCDWGAAFQSVLTIARLQPRLALTGHGVPVAGAELRQGLSRLIQNWATEGTPGHGRYVSEPARVSHDGVRSVPPPVPDRQLAALVGVGVSLLAGAWVLSSRRAPA